jgi:cytochrome c oxidase subunit 2
MLAESLRRGGSLLQSSSAGLPAHPGIQSAFESHGPAAEHIELLARVLFVGGALVFGVVLLAAVAALCAPPRWRAHLARPGFVIAAGLAFPAVVLSALLGYNVVLTERLLREGNGPPLRIGVVGEQWWWRIVYFTPEGAVDFETANEIRIPVAREVELVLDSQNVIHSLWVPNLAGKLDLVPGRSNRLQVRADRAGVFRGQCAEFCGLAHSQMALFVVASDADGFESWRRQQRQPAATAAGWDLFDRSGCGGCHAVRGTPARGTLGPDLTHVGGRLSLGAGVLPVNPGTLSGWTASAPHIKPGAKMPAFTQFSGAEQRAIGAWLAGLE